MEKEGVKMEFLGSVIAIDFNSLIQYLLFILVCLWLLFYIGYLTLHLWYLKIFKTKCPKCGDKTLIYVEYVDNFGKYSVDARCSKEDCNYDEKVK